MELIRSFIAIELPDELKVKLKKLEAELKARCRASVKWVDPESIHLTLKFLGNVAADRINEITAVIERAAQGIPPFHLDVGGLGVFPGPKRVRVAWVGLQGEIDRLMQLQKQVETGLVPLGFAAEARPFAAHLTIARVREEARPHDRLAFGELIAATRFDTADSFCVDHVNLMRSQLSREGAVYTRLTSVPLR